MKKSPKLFLLLIAFATSWAAQAQTTLPYEYGFETEEPMSLWTTISGSILRYPIQHNANNGTYYLRFQGSPTTRLIALPEFSEATNTLRLEFYTRPEQNTYTYCGTFDVGYMTNLTDANSFVIIDTYSYNDWGTNTYEKKTVNFTSAPANSFIAMRHNATHEAYYWYVDDVTVIPMSDCHEPTNVLIQEGSLTAYSVTIAWDAEENDSFQFALLEGIVTDFSSLNWSEPTQIDHINWPSSLSPDSDYTFVIRKYCNSTEQSYPIALNFHTLETCPSPTDLIATDVAAHTSTLDWSGTSQNQGYNVWYRKAAGFNPILIEDFENGATYNANWEVVNMSTNNGNRIGRFTDAAHGGSYGFRFSSWSYSNSYEEHLINKNALTGLTDESVIEFYYKKFPSSDSETFKVGYSSTNNEISSFIFGDNYEATGEWQLFHETIPAGTKYISIRYTTTTCQYYLYIDDISISLPIPPDSWNYIETSSVPYTIQNLIPETRYEAYVQGVCGNDGNSSPSETITFTTTEACPTPAHLSANNITSVSADLSWEGNSEVESYTVRYRTSEYVQGFNEPFTSTPPDEWTRYSANLNSNGTATMTSGSIGWNFGSNNNVFDNHAYINLYGLKNYWLVTPNITIGNGYSLSFDVAYTTYLGNNATPATGCTTHRFVVLISTDNEHWTILREWNNSGSNYILDNISPYGQHINSISLANYAGHAVYIAFFAHSESSNYDNNLHVDNVSIGQTIPAGTWQTITVPGTNSVETGTTLTGLVPGFSYDSQVKSNCANIWCEAISFKTVFFNQNSQLSQGWNWWAPTVQVTATQLQNTIGNNLLQIIAKEGPIGSTDVISPGEMYRIQTTAPCNVNLTGVASALVEVNIVSGYNWFGYAAFESAPISEVFDEVFCPTIGDKIISQEEGFAFFNGTTWEGTLTILEPGAGYIYISNATETKTLVLD